ncbi:MAG: low affinity iron permease family protein, partial [Mesorhizobium sp.]
VSKAKNTFIGIEHLTESEVEEIRAKCERAAKRHDEQIADMAAAKAVAKKRNAKKHTAA